MLGIGYLVAISFLGLVSCGRTERSSGSSGESSGDASTGGTLTNAGGLGGSGGGGSGAGGSGAGGSGAGGSGGAESTTSSSGGGESTTSSSGGSAGDGSGGTGGEPEPPWFQEAELPETGAQEAAFATDGVWLHDGTAALGGDGNVRVFVEQDGGWVEQLHLAPDATDQRFGSSVVVFEDTLLVGAPGDGEGSVYVFDRTGATWNETGRLRPSQDPDVVGFGSGVALSGGAALVAASQGAPYSFTRDASGAWNTERRLVLSEDHGPDVRCSVAVDGDTALVGVHDPDSTDAAYVYAREGTGWALQAQLVPELDEPEFGAVALSGDTALVSAPYHRDYVGAVHVFTREGGAWKSAQVLVGTDDYGYFGSHVAIHSNVLLATTRYEGYYTGGVHVFERVDSTWNWIQELVSPRGFDFFGASVSVFADTVLVAAPGFGEASQYFGSAYVFTRVTNP